MTRSTRRPRVLFSVYRNSIHWVLGLGFSLGLGVAPTWGDSIESPASPANSQHWADSSLLQTQNQDKPASPGPELKPLDAPLPKEKEWAPAPPTALETDTSGLRLPNASMGPANDTLPLIAPFPEVQDTLPLRFPYRAEFLSPAWDSVVRALTAQTAAAAARAQSKAGAPRGSIPVAKLPNALLRPVRILLKRENAAFTVNLQGDFGLARLDGPQAIPQAVVVRGNTSIRSRGRDLEIVDASGTRHYRDCRGLRLTPARSGVYFDIGGTPYRGSLDVVGEPASNVLNAINVLPMEEYLRGVLPYELGHVESQAIDALRALAVVARTYALKRMLRPNASRFDLYADVQDQVYKGMKDEYALSDDAIRETRGQVLLHSDTLVQTFYHSTCGGRTANREEVWDGGPIPYLISRDDLDPQGKPWCSTSPMMQWKQTWSASDLAAILRRNFTSGRAQGPSNFRSLEGFTVIDKTRCGRNKTLRIDTDAGPVVLRGDRIRWALKPIRSDGRILESAKFEIALQDDRVTAIGSGFGHGVGLCQYGAMNRARAGQGYREILIAYFAGTKVVEYR